MIIDISVQQRHTFFWPKYCLSAKIQYFGRNVVFRPKYSLSAGRIISADRIISAEMVPFGLFRVSAEITSIKKSLSVSAETFSVNHCYSAEW